MKTEVFRCSLFIFILLGTFLLNSCYSVRLRSVEGTPEPAFPMVRDDYYRTMQVIELDTVITIGALDKDFTYLIKRSDLCPSGKLHTVEYRNTFGAVLLSGITFGRKRKVKIKYVCMKSN
ncbi:hypothetical protein L0P88_21525 [Muricauda sp. SCSIO 64092]|uniref:hypothetical protein n=1 Tax=Allomuricauda sp. SCSIO 64092 TaxID=2908842 RepID=UPI001FF27A47|nr:hypothetical protein [Muricauda sp. SCSIO 64092]UOY06491.1 hypothetical protein L0P88_21525 [Muricauda sp. SCSIO 64092]